MTGPRVAILDYDAGNLRSAEKALQRAGADAFVTAEAEVAAGADALVVPGVGHFGQCVRQFRAAGFTELVTGWVAAGRPLLGICVGMQILYERSEEDPEVAGLGLLPGVVRRLPAGLVVPHMGWNTVAAVRDDPVAAAVDGERCYFVHSYYADPSDRAHVLATTSHGAAFPSIVRAGACVGTQFHPEKSGATGARLLGAWLHAIQPALT